MRVKLTVERDGTIDFMYVDNVPECFKIIFGTGMQMNGETLPIGASHIVHTNRCERGEDRCAF